MKKSIITLILVLFIGTSFAQNYQVVRKIVATPDCRTRFLNSQNVQIFEVNSFDMTYNFLSSTQLQIRDYKNSVTIYKAQTSSPIFDSLPSFLDSIKTACLIFSDTAGIYGVVAGTNITIDNTNIKFPIISSSGGGGSTYYAGNGLYIDNDSVKLGGILTEKTKIYTNGYNFFIKNGDIDGNGYNGSQGLIFGDNDTYLYDTTQLYVGVGQSLGLVGDKIQIFKRGGTGFDPLDSLDLSIINLPYLEEPNFVIGLQESGYGTGSKYQLFRTPISSGGGSSYLAKNGIYINSDTIKLGGNITENTKLDNPNSKSVQIGSDGDAMNLNVVPPFPYSGLINSYSGYDYRSAEYMSFIGVLKGLNFPDLGFINQDMVGTFTIVGNPFDSIYPDGSIMIDGVWELGGQVAMNKVYLTFLGDDLIFNLVSQFQNEQTSLIESDNANQTQFIDGNNANQTQSIEGDNAIQQNIIIGDSANQNQSIIGEDGEISRSIVDSVNNARALEEITSTSYLFSGLKVVGSNTIRASNSISPNGFVREFQSGSLTNRDTLNENMYKVEAGNITLKLDSTGLNYGTTYSPFNLSGGAIKYEKIVGDTLTLKSSYLKINPVFLGFYNKEPILQPVLPLGSSTDDVIQVLQNLGLVRED